RDRRVAASSRRRSSDCRKSWATASASIMSMAAATSSPQTWSREARLAASAGRERNIEQTRSDAMKDILDNLGLGDVNPGTWSGSRSFESASAPLIESVNPATNEVIASVRATTQEEYDQVVEAARTA